MLTTLRRPTGTQAQIALIMGDDGVGQLYPVDRADAESISCAGGTYPMADVRRIILADGRTLYLVRADLPARQEAERIRQLEEAAFLRSLFGGRSAAAGNIPLPFWVLVFAMLVGLVILGAR